MSVLMRFSPGMGCFMPGEIEDVFNFILLRQYLSCIKIKDKFN